MAVFVKNYDFRSRFLTLTRLCLVWGQSQLMPAGLLHHLLLLLHDGHGRDGQVQDDGGLSTIDCREMTNTEESVCLSRPVCLSGSLSVLSCLAVLVRFQTAPGW